MQFINNLLKEIKNPFIINERADELVMKLPDSWCGNSSGNKFRCEISLKGHKISEIKVWQNDSSRVTEQYYPWYSINSLSGVGSDDSLDFVVYKMLYTKWEKELEWKYRSLNIKKEDVVHAYNTCMDRWETTHEENEKNLMGDVYLVKMKGLNYYKIGVTKNIENRIKSLQNGNPIEIQLIKSIPVADMYAKENYLHSKYDYANMKNEWFEFNLSEVEEIIDYLSKNNAMSLIS